MDGQTDGPTDKAGCKVAWHATKNQIAQFNVLKLVGKVKF